MKEIFTYYKRYQEWLDRYNRLVRARNKKKIKNYSGNSMRGPDDLETELEESLTGFLAWGARYEAS